MPPPRRPAPTRATPLHPLAPPCAPFHVLIGTRCLYLNALPFGDELRQMEFAPPPKEGAAGAAGVGAAQQAAADALLDALDFCKPAADGAPRWGWASTRCGPRTCPTPHPNPNPNSNPNPNPNPKP